MRLTLLVLLALLLAASPARGQGFGPKSYPDCVMLYVKKAQSLTAGMLLRQACKCRFQDASLAECKRYSPAALDCLVANLSRAESDEDANAIERSCRLKNSLPAN